MKIIDGHNFRTIYTQLSSRGWVQLNFCLVLSFSQNSENEPLQFLQHHEIRMKKKLKLELNMFLLSRKLDLHGRNHSEFGHRRSIFRSHILQFLYHVFLSIFFNTVSLFCVASTILFISWNKERCDESQTTKRIFCPL